MFPFESAVEGSLERSRDDRLFVQQDTPNNDHANRATPLSGTQLQRGITATIILLVGRGSLACSSAFDGDIGTQRRLVALVCVGSLRVGLQGVDKELASGAKVVEPRRPALERHGRRFLLSRDRAKSFVASSCQSASVSPSALPEILFPLSR